MMRPSDRFWHRIEETKGFGMQVVKAFVRRNAAGFLWSGAHPHLK